MSARWTAEFEEALRAHLFDGQVTLEELLLPGECGSLPVPDQRPEVDPV